MKLAALIKGGVKALKELEQAPSDVAADARLFSFPHVQTDQNANERALHSSTQHRLEQFALEVIDEGSDARAVIDRINNMAWEFMEADGMTFHDAIRLAAEIVATCPVAPCEAAYLGFRGLLKRLTKSQ